MTSETQLKLANILYNIELQIHDLKLEKQGYNLKIYFDSFDIEDALKGFSSFYKANQFDPKYFQSDKCLVRCLASSGNLTKIHVLPPHKAELLNRLKKLKNAFDDRPDMMAVNFLKDIDSELLKNTEELFKKNYHETIENLLLKPLQSEKLFRTIQNLSPWYKRLQEVINEERFMLESFDEPTHYTDIINSNYFSLLKKVFNSIRPGEMDINNTTDALSVSILIDRISRFKKKDSSVREIPIFFASSDLIKIFTTGDLSKYKAPVKSKIKILKDYLSFDKTSQNLPVSVIRDESYFIYKAIFCPNESLSKRNEQIEELLARLLSWSKQIKEFLNVDFLQDKSTTPINTWLADLDTRQKEFFFQEIWLKSKAPKDLYKAVVNVVEAYQEFKKYGQAELRSRISAAIEQTEAKINREVKDARTIVELSQKVERDMHAISQKLKHGIKKMQGTTQQKIFNILPFVRYSFPNHYHNFISDRISLLLDSQTFDIFGDWLLNGYAELIDEINNHNFDKNPNNTENLIVVSAALVALEAVAPLKHMLEKLDPSLPHFSLKILLAEMNFQTLDSDITDNKQRRHGRARTIIRELETMFRKELDIKTKNGLCIGLAFIYYRWWKSNVGKSVWNLSENEKPTVFLLIKDNEELIEKSIFYAEKAYDLWTSTESTEPEELYALNLSLYYMLKSDKNTDEDFQKVERYANRLISYAATDEDKWQFRYDDTLSFYYCKYAKTKPKNKTVFKNIMKDAEFYLKKAKKVVLEDAVISETERLFKSIQANSPFSK